MFEGITTALKQFGTTYQELDLPKKIGVAGVLALVVAGFVFLLVFTGQPDYEVMYTDLTKDDAAQLVGKLQELKIPYKLEQDGSVVMVPAENLLDTRLELAKEGLPKGGGIGFEVFDETRMGATEFVQRVNYQRAIQGELSRTINQFKEIVSSRVHIVTPRETLFIEEQKKPSAAVVLKLKDGATLKPVQVKAIVNLVAASVEGLEPDQVNVADTLGRVLYDKEEDSQVAGLTQTQSEYVRKLESGMVAKIQALLDRVVGPGKSISKVSADVNFDREQRVEEIYDPEVTAVRSSQSSEEESQGQGQRPIGSPDDQFKITAQSGGASGESSSYTRAGETLNYEINKVNRQVVKAGGEIKRLSVAVIIDGKYQETPPAQEGQQPTRTFVPRTDEELARFVTLVRSAVGYNEDRGDVVEVTSMPFEEPEVIEAPPPTIVDQILMYARMYGRTALIVLLAILFYFFVVRPMVKWSGRELKEVVVEADKLPAPGAEDEAFMELEDLRKKGGPKEKAAFVAQKEPDLALEVIRSWLHETRYSGLD